MSLWIASKINCISPSCFSILLSSSPSLQASSLCASITCLNFTKVFMMLMLILTALSLLRTLASIATPCSVKAYGKYAENFNGKRWLQIATTSPFSCCGDNSGDTILNSYTNTMHELSIVSPEHPEGQKPRKARKDGRNGNGKILYISFWLWYIHVRQQEKL